MSKSGTHKQEESTGRLMGLDVGDKTIGVALSDELGLTAQPYETLKRQGDAEVLRTIRRIVVERGITAVIVGLPMNMDGTIGRQARKVIAFAERIKATLDVPVVHWDERLSTVAAERVLVQADVSREKRKVHVDKLAAAVILQGYLDSDDAASRGCRSAGTADPTER
jgi:putative Holliday junction resolvase